MNYREDRVRLGKNTNMIGIGYDEDIERFGRY